ncbi:MAG: hypothetical protein H3C62_03510, partial [Gemmatimonadaceae bacterium]|nr:hypothetical protein [Gemmatimonadaceae bacterium]
MQRVFRFTFRTQKVLATSVCALMLAAACSDPVTPSDKPGLLSRVSSLRTLPTVELNARRGLYLTYGQPVPEGQIVDRLPEPYDVRKHGRPRTSDEVGVPAQHSRSYIRSKDPRRSAIAPNLGATDAHAGIFLTSEHRGIYGLMDVRSDVDIPTGWLDALVYAPTNMPGGGSCIEVTTIHWRGADWNHTFNDALGVWDWCNDIAFVNFWTFTSTFKSKYVRSVTDEWGTPREKYYLVIVADDVDGAYQSYDTWRFFLYNYNTGLYDQMWAIAGELGQ